MEELKRCPFCGGEAEVLMKREFELSKQCRVAILSDIAKQKAFEYGDDCDEGNWMRLKEELERSSESEE